MSATKNILIGIFVLLAFGIIIFILLFLHPSVGDNGIILRVRFTDIDKINVGTRVTFAGLPVGEVIKIKEIPEARFNRAEHNGEIYVYELTLQVDSSVKVYNSDEIYIRTSGLLGERYIEIDPQPLQKGQELLLIENSIIYAEPSASVESTLKQFGTVSNKIDVVLDNFNDVLSQIKKNEIIPKLGKAAENIVDITHSLNKPELWERTLNNIVSITDDAKKAWPTVDQTIHNFHDFSSGLNQTLASYDTAGKNFSHASEHFRDMLQYAKSGEGNIGRLFMHDDLYLRFKAVLNKGGTVFDDIKHYGVLFQNSKQWQRANARRMNLMNRLSDPNEFSTYFNNEVDQISTSLSNVSMVLNEEGSAPQDLICNPNFKERLAELLKKSATLEEALKMYNEQIYQEEETLN